MVNKMNHLIVKRNCNRKGCKDVFNSFLVSVAMYEGIYDFPIIHSVDVKPNNLIRFSKCISNKNYNCWIHFYEDDYLFERLWRNPKKYLSIIKRYKGVILPDFSLYRDMPFSMQIWNIYRSRAIGNWLQYNGVSVIPNIRFGDERTYSICCDDIEQNSIIAIGTHGTMKNAIDRAIFINGLEKIINKLKPKTIVIYGSCPNLIIEKCKEYNAKLLHFAPDYYSQLSLNLEDQ